MSKQLSYISIIYFLLRAFFIGFSFDLLIKTTRQDAWACVLLAYIVGFLPVLLIHYIASYEPEKNLKEKIDLLFPHTKKIIIFLIVTGVLFLSILSFWNLCNLITSQFLNKTPKFVIGISFLIPILLLLSKEDKVIARVSLILFYISMFLFVMSFLGLIFQFKLSNFQPYLTNNITKPVFSYIGFQVFPILLLLIFPDKNILPSLEKGYLLTAITLFIYTALIIGILGAPLAFVYQYPEFHLFKRAYESILTYRLENFFTTQWLFDIFIFCTVSLKSCNQLITWEKGIKSYVFPILMLLFSIFLFKDNTIANTIFIQYLSYILPSLFSIIIILLAIQVAKKKRRKSPSI